MAELVRPLRRTSAKEALQGFTRIRLRPCRGRVVFWSGFSHPLTNFPDFRIRDKWKSPAGDNHFSWVLIEGELMEDPADKIYTAEEAAEHLKISKRAILKLGRKYGCSVIGRHFRFTQRDLDRILDATRPTPAPHVIRSVYAPSISLRQHSDLLESLRPPLIVDRRVSKVMQAIDKHDRPVTSDDVAGCGERTIDILIGEQCLVEAGTAPDGRRLVRITPSGRERVRKLDAWHKKWDGKSRWRG